MRLLIAMLLMLVGLAPVQADAARPNIVVVMTDDMSLPMLDHMPRTLRVIGDRGTRFAQAFSPQVICCPARASFLTGQYATNHGVRANNIGGTFGVEMFDPSETIAVWLQRAGYRTGLFGKYLNGYPEKLPASYIAPGWDVWFAGRINFHNQYKYRMSVDGQEQVFTHYGTDELFDRAVNFVTTGAQPFFAFVTPSAPHSPRNPAPRHATLFPGLTYPRTPAFCEADMSDKPAFLPVMDCTDASLVREQDIEYRDSIRTLQAVDEGMERLVDALAAAGRLSNTIIVFTSDHGMHFGDHRIDDGKDMPYETDTRIPLLVRGPGIPAGKVSQHLTTTIDVTATLLGMANAGVPAMVDGSNREGVWRGSDNSPPRQSFMISRWVGENNAALHPNVKSVRTKRWKLIEWDGGASELYDLVNDPHEVQSLAGRPETAEVQAALSTLLARLATCRGIECRAIEREPAP